MLRFHFSGHALTSLAVQSWHSVGAHKTHATSVLAPKHVSGEMHDHAGSVARSVSSRMFNVF